MNTESGTFATHVDYPTATSPFSVAIGDINGDTNPDILVACSNDVSILLDNGDGAFQTHSEITPGGSSIVVGDFNGDGFLDFVVVDVSGGANLFVNNGHGSFGSLPVPINYLPVFVLAADFNGDGKLDLAIEEVSRLGVTGEVFLGKGDGTFQPPQRFEVTAGYPVVADFNGDGILDMAFVDQFVCGGR